MDSQQRQRYLRSCITPEERKKVSLILATQIDERLRAMPRQQILTVLIKFAVLFKAMAEERELGPLVTASVDKDLKELNILDIIDLYVAHRPEEA